MSSTEDPPVIKTKLRFKRTASSSSNTSKRRKTANENKIPNGTSPNGNSSSKPYRQPDFDFTNDEDVPLPKVSKVFWPDRYSFKDALFSALSDPDDARHWAQIFGSEIHIYPRPRPQMSDDEYATWVREQVYSHGLRESHKKREAAAQRERLQQEAKL